MLERQRARRLDGGAGLGRVELLGLGERPGGRFGSPDSLDGADRERAHLGVHSRHGTVQEGRRPVDDGRGALAHQASAGRVPAPVGSGPGRRDRDVGLELWVQPQLLAAEAGLEPAQGSDVRLAEHSRQRAANEDDDRIAAELAIHGLRGRVVRRGRGDERVQRRRWRQRQRDACTGQRQHDHDDDADPQRPGGQHPRAQALESRDPWHLQSIESGPCASPARNCRMNGLSELSMSSAGPASTIRPLQSTLM